MIAHSDVHPSPSTQVLQVHPDWSTLFRTTTSHPSMAQSDVHPFPSPKCCKFHIFIPSSRVASCFIQTTESTVLRQERISSTPAKQTRSIISSKGESRVFSQLFFFFFSFLSAAAVSSLLRFSTGRVISFALRLMCPLPSSAQHNGFFLTLCALLVSGVCVFSCVHIVLTSFFILFLFCARQLCMVRLCRAAWSLG